jgi:glycosyltransferase involved in cell wall biosynthesis
VTVVLLSRNRMRGLQRTIAEFHRTLVHPEHDDVDRGVLLSFADYELLVVDDASTDGSASYLRDAVRQRMVSRAILSRHRRGDAACANLGFALASPGASAYTRLGVGVVPSTPGWLPRALDVLAREPAVGALTLMGRGWSFVPRASRCWVGIEPLTEWVKGPGDTVGLILPRRVFARLGHFAEDIPGADEAEYCARVAGEGLGVFRLQSLRASGGARRGPPDRASPPRRRFYPVYEELSARPDQLVIEVE